MTKNDLEKLVKRAGREGLQWGMYPMHVFRESDILLYRVSKWLPESEDVVPVLISKFLRLLNKTLRCQ